jgi:hypothetical protein
MTLLAAFQVLLQRQPGQTTSPSATDRRPQPSELEGLTDFRQYARRARRLERRSSFADLARVRAHSLDATRIRAAVRKAGRGDRPA